MNVKQWITGAALISCQSSIALAQIDVAIADQTLDRLSGTTGSFFLTVTSGSAADIDGYDFELSVASQPGAVGSLMLVGAGTPASMPLFPAGNPVFIEADELFPAYVGDSSSTPATAMTGTNIVEIMYSVSNDAFGDFIIDFVGDADGVYSLGIDQLANTEGGVISVTVPEPTMAILLLIGSPMITMRRRRA